jgi:myo-inositol-1(or 4)-monophosphatase
MDNKYWLDLCKNIGDKVFVEIKKYLKSEDRKKILKVGFGGDNTLLIDDVAEKIILETFESTGRSFKLISEEFGEATIGKKPEVSIIVDPVDGSNNLRFGIPFASTSIAIGDNSGLMKGIQVGYIKNLINGDYYHAIKSSGAFKNDKKINVNKDEIGCLLIDVVLNRKENFTRISDFGEGFKYIRMLGSGCLGLCFVADGTVDGYLGLGAKRSVDQAATQLLVKEAGGIVKTIDGNDFSNFKIGFNLNTEVIAASNNEIFEKVKSLLK